MIKKDEILIIAAENSAEKYASFVVDEFSSNNSRFFFFGVGGNLLKDLGVDIIYDSKELSVVGIIEVLSSIFKLKILMNNILKEVKRRDCKTAILVDYPDFNLILAKKLKKNGVDVYFYISPTVWAWRYSRVKIIKKYIKRMFIIFPFEKEIYEREEIPFTYTGHPIVSRVTANENKTRFISRENIKEGEKIITILPGSRKSEIEFLLIPMLETVNRIRKTKKIRLFLLLAENIDELLIMEKLKNFPELCVKIYKQRDGYNLIKNSDLVISTSGTSNLEIALLRVPFISIYRVNKLSYFLGKNFLTINLYSIVNILAKKEVIKEFIQENLTVDNIFEESMKILDNKGYVNKMMEEFDKIKASLTQEESPSHIIYKTIINEVEERDEFNKQES